MRLSLFLILVSEKLGFLSYKAEYVPDTYDHYHCTWICTKYISKEYITRDIIKITLKSVSRENFKQLKSKLRDFQNCKNISGRNLSIQVLEIILHRYRIVAQYSLVYTVKSEIHPLALKKGWRKERARDIVFFNQPQPHRGGFRFSLQTSLVHLCTRNGFCGSSTGSFRRHLIN